MKNFKTLILVLAFSCASSQASSDLYSYHFEYGEAEEDVSSYSIGVRRDVTGVLQQKYNFLKSHEINSAVELDLFQWQAPGDDLFGVSASLVLDKEFETCWKFDPYVEYGFGFALISNTQIGELDMSSAFQFQNRIGLGFRSESTDLFVRLAHVSNGGIVDPNHGIDILSVGVRFSF